MIPLALFLLLACSGREDAGPPPATPAKTTTPSAPDRPTDIDIPAPPDKPSAVCSGLAGGLARAAVGDMSGFTLDDAGRVTVIIETSGSTSLPASFVEDKRALTIIEGRTPPSDLCTLAQSEGVKRVRTPFPVDPK